jgi:hypothetical protein
MSDSILDFLIGWIIDPATYVWKYVYEDLVAISTAWLVGAVCIAAGATQIRGRGWHRVIGGVIALELFAIYAVAAIMFIAELLSERVAPAIAYSSRFLTLSILGIILQISALVIGDRRDSS